MNTGIYLTDESALLVEQGVQIIPDNATGIALTHDYIYYYINGLGSGYSDIDHYAVYRIDYSGENWESLGKYNSYGW